MITFETQEAFDAAVMAAVEKYLRLELRVSGGGFYSDSKNVTVALMNHIKDKPTQFSSDYDSV